MTAAPSIDPALLLHENLAQASPDRMRELLTTFVNVPAVGGRRRGVRRRLRRPGPAGAARLIEGAARHRPPLVSPAMIGQCR